MSILTTEAIKLISTTIKREYMDLILKGEKKVEYKAPNEYWIKRLGIRHLILGLNPPKEKEHKVINFLCGRKSYKYKINKITLDKTPDELIGWFHSSKCFHIHLGDRIGGD